MMKKVLMGIGVLLLLVILFIIFAPAPDPSTAPNTESTTDSATESYTNTRADFSLSYPAEWFKVDDPGTGALVMFQAPSDGDSFGENVNVLTQDLSGSPMTLDQYHDMSVSQVKEQLGNAHVFEDTKTTVAGLDAYRLSYEGVYPNQDQPLKFLQLFVLRGDTMYLFTYTSVPDAYDTYLSEVNALFDSISFN